MRVGKKKTVPELFDHARKVAPTDLVGAWPLGLARHIAAFAIANNWALSDDLDWT